MRVSIPYERGGRVKQKARTRQALVEAARRLLADGIAPTVEQTAAAASISRPTAYRYFPTRQALLRGAHPELAQDTLLPPTAPQDPMQRLDLASRELVRLLLQNEVALRAMLRISLEEESSVREPVALRTGRRIVWIEDALAPLKTTLKPKRFRELVLSIASTLGIEPLVWLIDVAKVERDEAAEILRSNARKLLRAAL